MKKLLFSVIICLLLFVAMISPVAVYAVSPEGDSAEIPYYTHNYVMSDSYSAQPVNAVYDVEAVLNARQIGVEEFGELNDICTDKNNRIYILDGKKSRIVILNDDLTLRDEIKEITLPDGATTRFEGAKGIYVHTDGLIYIADTTGKRVLVCDGSHCVKEMLLPDSTLIPEDFNYQPIKITVDSKNHVYVLSDGSYYGAILYSPDGGFLGFYGANQVKTTVTQFISKLWKKLTTTNAKRSNSASQLPYQFTDLYVDDDDFIYTATGKTSATMQTGQIRQLSPSGANILDSDDVIFGDYYVTSINNMALDQNIAGLAVDSRDFIYCYDISYGRIYLYNKDCYMLAAFGGGAGKGNQKGTFFTIAGIDLLNDGDRIVAIDSHDLDITVFRVTDYGKLLKNAHDLDLNGEYDKTQDLCEEILKVDSGNVSAYYIMSKAAMQSGDYKAALAFAEKGMSKELYTQAFTYLRKAYLKDHFNLLLIIGILIVGAVVAVCICVKKRGLVLIKNGNIKSALLSPLHPAIVFQEMKRGKTGSVIVGSVIMLLFYIITILKTTMSGFLFKPIADNSYNSLLVFARTIGFVLLWTLINWAMATLLGGVGKMKEIFIVITYSLLPMILGNTVYIIFSYCLNLTEGEFLTMFFTVTVVLTVFMVVVGSVIIHDVSFGRFVGITVVTFLGMLIVVFIMILVVLLLQQTWSFAGTLIRELFFR